MTMSINGNVVRLPGAELRAIELATVHSNGTVLNGSRNQVWLCPAYAGAYEHMLYVKPMLSARQIVAELLCANVAIAMDLPCPPPYLVAVAPHHVGLPRGHTLLAFGSQQVGTRSNARVIRNLDVLFEALQKAKAMDGLCVLDEWTANSVRHERDVVFDPKGGIWIIDHESAVPAGLKPDEFVTNWLADRLRTQTEPNKRPDLFNALRRKAARFRALRLTGAPVELTRLMYAVQTWEQVVEFLNQRLTHLDQLLSQRMLPDQAYLPLTTTTKPDKRESI